MEDTTLTIHGQPYALEKGSMVFLAMPLVHKDPDIHKDPDTYKIDRFIHMHTNVEQKVYMKNGVQVRTPLFPWGGGHFMVNISFEKLIIQCTGRKFARGEVLIFACSILHQLEISSVDENVALEIPSAPSIERFGGGAEFPGRPWKVRLRFRQY